MSKNDKIRDELIDLDSNAFSSSAVCIELFIYPGFFAQPKNSPESSSSPALPSDEHGDVLVHGLFGPMYCILDI